MTSSNLSSAGLYFFLNDILIYKSTWSAHLQLVRAVLQVLRLHTLLLKRSKCYFGETFVAHLSHIISGQGVAMDSSKVAAVETWPTPMSVRALQGFLGLTGYYRKFIQNYGAVAASLIKLLKKEGFSWSMEAKQAFQALKKALITGPVLQLPDFSQKFMVDYDASSSIIGAVLHQGDRPSCSLVVLWRHIISS